jgi:hypothetical protein
MMLDIGEGDVKVTVLVNVGEFADNAQGVHHVPTSVIGLNTLDECKRGFGNVRHLSMETVVPRGIGWRVKPEREATSLVPSLGQGGSCMIALDEIESQIIDSGPELIDDLSRNNRDVWRRLPEDLQLIFAIRVREDVVRLTCNVWPDDVLEELQVFRCSTDFEISGFESSKHEIRSN